MSSPLPPLPIDISTFERLRNGGYLYVDKTRHGYDLITKGHRYFLSRPRRFGKTLFVSMLKDILSGKRELFRDLWVSSSDYQWKQHGIIALDFSSLDVRNDKEFSYGLSDMLAEISSFYGLKITLDRVSPGLDLRKVVQALYARFGYVAILIDEYDSPVLKKLHDREVAETMRDTLHAFFSVIKALDPYIHFVFITGVSSFAKAGIFSGMNNLQILTMRDNCADICGYSDAELDLYFKDYMQAWADKQNITYDEQRQRIKDWYNGYRFSKDQTTVYNPFSLMNALHEQTFENFWFRSGTPKFLIEELKHKQHKDFNEFDSIVHPGKLKISQDSLGIFDVGATPLPALMFQTGYLTVTDYDHDNNVYQLGYPNREVEKALQKHLLTIFTHLDSIAAEDVSLQLKTAFQGQDCEAIVRALKHLFAHIPHQIHAKAEYSTDQGRIDVVVELASFTYIIEVKFNIPAARALAQIEERKYYERFTKPGKKILLLGLSFKRGKGKFNIEYEAKVLPVKND